MEGYISGPLSSRLAPPQWRARISIRCKCSLILDSSTPMRSPSNNRRYSSTQRQCSLPLSDWRGTTNSSSRYVYLLTNIHLQNCFCFSLNTPCWCWWRWINNISFQALLDKQNILAQFLPGDATNRTDQLTKLTELLGGLNVADLKQRDPKELAMSAIVHGNRLLDSINQGIHRPLN